VIPGKVEEKADVVRVWDLKTERYERCLDRLFDGLLGVEPDDRVCLFRVKRQRLGRA
jgi:hypothetical protein